MIVASMIATSELLFTALKKLPPSMVAVPFRVVTLSMCRAAAFVAVSEQLSNKIVNPSTYLLSTTYCSSSVVTMSVPMVSVLVVVLNVTLPSPSTSPLFSSVTTQPATVTP